MKNEDGLRAIVAHRVAVDSLWSGRYKIPWDEPGFSGRMLAEHLSQGHDLASRRCETIDAQVRWIHEQVCGCQCKRILDLGCGPGLYLQRLVELGHDCCGIDFSPASVAYARECLGEKCRVERGDLRSSDFGSGFDVAMMIFGEVNVFSPEECLAILRKAHTALAGGGTLVIESHTFDAVKQVGQAPNSWYRSQPGLFSSHPHLCLIENFWFEEEATALQVFHVLDTRTGEVETYRNTIKAWTDEEYRELLGGAGFSEIEIHEDWPTHSSQMLLWTARKG